jgi:hypothetical protein
VKDLNINIGGPTDQARQSVSFQIHNDHREGSLEPERIVTLVRELRASLEAEPLPEDDRRRLERHLTGIEEEARGVRHGIGLLRDHSRRLAPGASATPDSGVSVRGRAGIARVVSGTLPVRRGK